MQVFLPTRGELKREQAPAGKLNSDMSVTRKAGVIVRPFSNKLQLSITQ